MNVISREDMQIFENMVSLTQENLKKTLTRYLQTKYDNVIITKDYVVAVGGPIGLVAHLDTVFPKPAKKVYYDSRKGVLWSPDGLGADDRAGVFAIIKILQSNPQIKPSIILTTDEEKGGLGAAVLAQVPCPIPNLKYLIQLDRRGTNDCVFYDCYNTDFMKYVKSFGFVEAFGSFSDISFLGPGWQVCSVNLSVGYEDEHSYSETLHIAPLFDTINKVVNMLSVDHIPHFEYKDIAMSYGSMYRGYNNDGYLTDYGAHCAHCGQLFSEYELMPVKALDGKIKFYCGDCSVENVDWCNFCGEPFEIVKGQQQTHVCPDCKDITTRKVKKK